MRDWSSPYPLVSVVITSFNYERYLAQAIESVLLQDYPNFELLVLDNASTDASQDVIQRYLSDPRLRFIRNEINIGLINNNNKGFEESRGEYVVFLSADDVFLPGHLSGAIEYYRRHPKVDVLYTRYLTMDDQGRMYERFHHPGIPGVEQFDNRNEFVDVLRADNYMCFPTMLFPRWVLKQHGGLSLDFPIAADYDMCVRYIAAGVRFGFLNVASIAMRWHATNRSRQAYVESGEQLREHVALLNRHIIPQNYWRILGRESDVLNMLRLKMNGLTAWPQTYEKIIASLQAEIDSVVTRLNESATIVKRDTCAFPRVSVIVPSKGNTTYLEDALKSLQAQTYQDFEAIIVHDGGPELEAFVRRFGDDDRFRYVRHTSQAGPSSARNTGIGLALGEILAYLDEDNRFEPQHLEFLVRALDDSGGRVAYSQGRIVLEEVKLGVRHDIAKDERIFAGASAWPVRVANAIPLNCVVHHRACLVNVGTFSEMPVLEDWEFLLRFGSVFPTAVFVDSRTVELRQRTGFADQHLRTSWPRYQSVLEALNAHYSASSDEPTMHARKEYAQRVAAAQPLMNDTSAASMLTLLRTLATP